MIFIFLPPARPAITLPPLPAQASRKVTATMCIVIACGSACGFSIGWDDWHNSFAAHDPWPLRAAALGLMVIATAQAMAAMCCLVVCLWRLWRDRGGRGRASQP